MGKTTKKRTLSPLKIILIVLAAVIGLPILFILGSVAINKLILQPIDKAKFESLDKDSRTLFAQVKKISAGAEPWEYTASCEAERSGPWATGSYYCTTKMSFEIPVSDALTVASLHLKYFPTIDSAGWLRPSTELTKLPANDFGINFVVSGAEKKYTSDNVDCTYSALLDQQNIDYSKPESTYGSKLRDSSGRLTLSFRCNGKTSTDWYSQI